MVSNFFYVALVCLLQPRCRFLINIARGSAEVQCHVVLLFYGHMIKRSFHTCSLWKGRKGNKQSTEKDKQDPLSKTFVAHCIFVLCLSGDKACGTLNKLSTLVTSVSLTGRSDRGDQVQGHAERRRRMCTFLTNFLGFYLLHYLVCYNVKHHAIVVTLTVRSLPSSSFACWSFKVFVSCLLHCTHPPRASQNSKEERKLWSCQPCRFCFVLL